jgi:predicted HTH transcriptional regulator
VIPHNLEGWTLPIVQTVAAAGVFENDVFDLKAALQHPEHQRKTVAAFANTAGGFLVFGVTNDREVIGVANSELPRDFGSRLTTGVEPSIEYGFAPPLRLSSDKAVVVCHVPKSKRGPHAVLVNNAWVFLKRGPSGSNEPMTYTEIRFSFVEAAGRRSYLLLLKNELERVEAYARLLNISTWQQPEVIFAPLGAGQFSPSLLETLMPEVFWRARC